MSKGSKYTKQVVEVDFQYPSEGIHFHWDRGEICHGLRSCSTGQWRAERRTSLQMRDDGSHCRSAVGDTLHSSAAEACAAVCRLPHQLCGGIPRPDGGGAQHGEGARQGGCHTGDAAHQRFPREGKHSPHRLEVAVTDAVLVRGMV